MTPGTPRGRSANNKVRNADLGIKVRKVHESEQSRVKTEENVSAPLAVPSLLALTFAKGVKHVDS